ncbi:MAG: 50S ribosomal protein L10 [Verrucomicrobia bacterium CG_4_10_14_3_um_filter_43_23]|nr:MAG: 50S ribosomal protein L10 [Verrucomicrobia bacterium CG1_02_43_26]PIP59623.1 MAG: 50S ribosomal protein L10 [Verrucomicrobia bacterium CG22_combo_CG10-13_8_21_14_all_43_17]PIX58922.1 MAG: 50S ribosomal protein L10 [Verrucomicrobia bacterium CG_4_10_14_3_um_filter_43_23]PIY61698.1 MAG: 50S ribosomal protein L10 [Verrucomicrobia bacterium CG_4_10_14_0_8_um_filter_43_34]PJA44582.1 MAG: 50S ribosomal protein L10 [Verrucomicrobia bacterium CG_4_9_14_3_um_filter_43_20]
MREGKQYLAKAVATHLEKSSYVLLLDYKGATVQNIADIRASLKKHKAEFHVVKNSALKVAAEQTERPDFTDFLSGPVAIIVGGDNPSEAAKVIVEFRKKNENKCAFKVGALGDRVLTAQEINELSKLPSLDVLRAQLMGLFNQPAEKLVRVFNAVPQGVLNVLDAHAKKG